MRKRALFVETSIAIVVICLLLLLLFPRFQNAQVLTKVAAAKRDLAAIIKAMESYRVDNPFHPIELITIYPEKNNPSQCNANLRSFDRSHSERTEYFIIQEKNLNPYLASYPIPQLPFETKGTIPNRWLPMYAVGSHDYRWSQPHITGNESDGALFCFTFYRDLYQSDYLGVAHGPLLTFYGDGWPNANGYDQFTFYDPSNGISSHGYITVESSSKVQKKSQEPPPVSPTPPLWTPQIKELKANLTSAPEPVTLPDATSLIHHFQTLISTIDTSYYCVFSDNFAWNAPEWDQERQHQYRVKVIKGELGNLATVNDVDLYYQSIKKPQTYPKELTFVWAGDDKQQSSNHSPKGTSSPWESRVEKRINGANTLLLFDPEKKSDKWTIPEKEKRFARTGNFNPLWFILPFRGQTNPDSITLEKQNDGLWRARRKSDSFMNNPTLFFLIDCLLDPSINYMPRKCLFANPTLNMQTPETDDTILMLDAWYVELDEYKAIDGVYFPTRMTISRWHHRPDPDSVPSLGSKTGYQKGFEIPDIIGGATVPVFSRKWDLTLTSAKINQPVDETVFSMEIPDGYHYHYQWE